MLEETKKSGIVNSYSLVQNGAQGFILITEFDTKPKMKKRQKARAAPVRARAAVTGQQLWPYHGAVKASG